YLGGNEPLTSLADHLDKVRTIAGSKGSVVTETGYHTAKTWTGNHPGVSEQAMGRYVLRLFLEFFTSGISRTYLYELIDEGTNTGEREQNFGLLRYDGSEKPAFTGLKNLIGLLSDPGAGFTPGKLGYALSGDTAGVRQLLLQRRDGRFYLVLWRT